MGSMELKVKYIENTISGREQSRSILTNQTSRPEAGMDLVAITSNNYNALYR